MINVLTCNGYWYEIPDSAPLPRVGDSIQFNGFTLKAKRVLLGTRPGVERPGKVQHTASGLGRSRG